MNPDPFDLIRDWFAAYNREELDTLESLYEPTASLEQDNGLTQSRDGIRTVLSRHFEEWQPRLRRRPARRVRMVGTHRKAARCTPNGSSGEVRAEAALCASGAATAISSQGRTLHATRGGARRADLVDDAAAQGDRSAAPVSAGLSSASAR